MKTLFKPFTSRRPILRDGRATVAGRRAGGRAGHISSAHACAPLRVFHAIPQTTQRVPSYITRASLFVSPTRRARATGAAGSRCYRTATAQQSANTRRMRVMAHVRSLDDNAAIDRTATP